MFYEDKKILNVEELEDGNKRVEVEIEPIENEDGSKDVSEKFTIPGWELAAVATEEKSDSSDARNKRAIIVVDEIYKVIKEKNIRTCEISFVMQKLLAKLQGIEEQAINNCFGVDNKDEIRIGNWENKL
jgi:hypothetical protein